MSENKPHVVLRKFNCSILSKDFEPKQPYEPIKDVDATYIGALVKSGFLKVKGGTGTAAEETIIEPEDAGSVMSMEDFENEGSEEDTSNDEDNTGDDNEDTDDKSDLDDLDAALADELDGAPENEADAEASTANDVDSNEGAADENSGEKTEEETQEETSTESTQSESPADVKKTPAQGLESIKNMTDKTQLVAVSKYFGCEVKGNLGAENYKKSLVEKLTAMVAAEAK